MSALMNAGNSTMAEATEISIANDFTPYPGGRYAADGHGSGEEFRDKILFRALEGADRVVVRLDGAIGYPVSFLEEAFGGLVRKGMTVEFLKSRLVLATDDPSLKPYIDSVWDFIERQAVRSN